VVGLNAPLSQASFNATSTGCTATGAHHHGDDEDGAENEEAEEKEKVVSVSSSFEILMTQ